jgi:hypothetical protein
VNWSNACNKAKKTGTAHKERCRFRQATAGVSLSVRVRHAQVERAADRAGCAAQLAVGVGAVVRQWRLGVEQVGDAGDDRDVLDAVEAAGQVPHLVRLDPAGILRRDQVLVFVRRVVVLGQLRTPGAIVPLQLEQ